MNKSCINESERSLKADEVNKELRCYKSDFYFNSVIIE